MNTREREEIQRQGERLAHQLRSASLSGVPSFPWSAYEFRPNVLRPNVDSEQRLRPAAGTHSLLESMRDSRASMKTVTPDPTKSEEYQDSTAG